MKNAVILATVFTLVNCLSSCKMAEKVDYVFPNNFNGWAIVVFDSKNGEQPIYNSGRMQLNLPHNGILFTKQKSLDGILDNHYYIKNTQGRLSKMYESIASVPRNDTSTPYILVESYQSLKFMETDSITKKEEWISFDNVILFKVVRGFSDTAASSEEIDKYIASIKQVLHANK